MAEDRELIEPGLGSLQVMMDVWHFLILLLVVCSTILSIAWLHVCGRRREVR